MLRQISFVIALFLAIAAGTRIGSTQDAQEAQTEGFAVDATAMMEMMKLAQPGPEHEALADRVGEWITEVSIRMMPGAEPMTQEGTATSRAILGGRFIEIVSDGDFMGQAFESRSIMGFDRRHEQYTMIGLDTLGTYWVTGKGEKDEDGVIRMHGEDDDPMGKQVYTFEYEILGPDEHEYRVVFHQLGGQVYEEPFTMVSVRSKRKTD